MNCEVCGKYKAVVKDHRDYAGYEMDYVVCKYCLNLNDYWFDRVLTKKNKDPKSVLSEEE